MEIIEEYCKNKLIDSTLFRDNSSKFLDPNFDIKAFLCEVLKLTDIPNINPVLSDTPPQAFPGRTDFSGLSTVGDHRASLGLTLSAGYKNFIPKSIVYPELYKYGGGQIINNIICTPDGIPIKVPVSGSFNAKEPQEKELEVFALLNDQEVKNLYPTYDFNTSICLDQPEIKIAELQQSINAIDQEYNNNPPVFEKDKDSYKELFVLDYELDLCVIPIDVNSLLIRPEAGDYKEFTRNFNSYGKEQHLLYFITFLNRFYLNRGWSISLHEIKLPPFFYIKLTKQISDNVFNTTSTIVNQVTSFDYTSNVRNVYFKYWTDQVLDVSKKLNIPEISINVSSGGFNAKSNAMMSALLDPIPDYRRIMKSSYLQKRFYLYSKKTYTEIPQYDSTATRTNNPQLKTYFS